MTKHRKKWLVWALVLLLAYVGSYAVLSRRAFREAEECGNLGFYFFTPEDTGAWHVKNYGLVFLYYPLILIDNILGTGRPVAGDPLFRVSG